MLTRLAALAALVPALVSATLQITSPTGAGWVGNTTVLCTWTWTATDPNFSIELGNPNIKTGLLASGPIAIANNIAANTGSWTGPLPVIPPGDDYFVEFVEVDNINNVYAKSPSFSISNNPTSSSVSFSSTPSSSGSKTSSLPSTSGKPTTSLSKGVGNSTGINTSTSPGSSLSTLPGTTTSSPTTQPITTLQISTTSTTTSTKKNAASSKMDIFMGWNVASLVTLGSIVLGSLVAA